MKKWIFPTIALLLSAVLLMNQYVIATDTATVAATVTVQNISVSVSDATITYGTLGQNATKSTCTSELNDLQTVTNTGNVAETFNIMGATSTNWALAATAGSDQYIHKFVTSTCATWSGGTALTLSYQTMITNIAANATSSLNLQINTPNPSTVYTQQNVNVTVQAVAF